MGRGETETGSLNSWEKPPPVFSVLFISVYVALSSPGIEAFTLDVEKRLEDKKILSNQPFKFYVYTKSDAVKNVSISAQCDSNVRVTQRCVAPKESLHQPHGDDWDPSYSDKFYFTVELTFEVTATPGQEPQTFPCVVTVDDVTTYQTVANTGGNSTDPPTPDPPTTQEYDLDIVDWSKDCTDCLTPQIDVQVTVDGAVRSGFDEQAFATNSLDLRNYVIYKVQHPSLLNSTCNESLEVIFEISRLSDDYRRGWCVIPSLFGTVSVRKYHFGLRKERLYFSTRGSELHLPPYVMPKGYFRIRAKILDPSCEDCWMAKDLYQFMTTTDPSYREIMPQVWPPPPRIDTRIHGHVKISASNSTVPGRSSGSGFLQSRTNNLLFNWTCIPEDACNISGPDLFLNYSQKRTIRATLQIHYIHALLGEGFLDGTTNEIKSELIKMDILVYPDTDPLEFKCYRNCNPYQPLWEQHTLWFVDFANKSSCKDATLTWNDPGNSYHLAVFPPVTLPFKDEAQLTRTYRDGKNTKHTQTIPLASYTPYPGVGWRSLLPLSFNVIQVSVTTFLSVYDIWMILEDPVHSSQAPFIYEVHAQDYGEPILMYRGLQPYIKRLALPRKKTTLKLKMFNAANQPIAYGSVETGNFSMPINSVDVINAKHLVKETLSKQYIDFTAHFSLMYEITESERALGEFEATSNDVENLCKLYPDDYCNISDADASSRDMAFDYFEAKILIIEDMQKRDIDFWSLATSARLMLIFFTDPRLLFIAEFDYFFSEVRDFLMTVADRCEDEVMGITVDVLHQTEKLINKLWISLKKVVQFNAYGFDHDTLHEGLWRTQRLFRSGMTKITRVSKNNFEVSNNEQSLWQLVTWWDELIPGAQQEISYQTGDTDQIETDFRAINSHWIKNRKQCPQPILVTIFVWGKIFGPEEKAKLDETELWISDGSWQRIEEKVALDVDIKWFRNMSEKNETSGVVTMVNVTLYEKKMLESNSPIYTIPIQKHADIRIEISTGGYPFHYKIWHHVKENENDKFLHQPLPHSSKGLKPVVLWCRHNELIHKLNKTSRFPACILRVNFGNRHGLKCEWKMIDGEYHMQVPVNIKLTKYECLSHQKRREHQKKFRPSRRCQVHQDKNSQDGEIVCRCVLGEGFSDTVFSGNVEDVSHLLALWDLNDIKGILIYNFNIPWAIIAIWIIFFAMYRVSRGQDDLDRDLRKTHVLKDCFSWCKGKRYLICFSTHPVFQSGTVHNISFSLVGTMGCTRSISIVNDGIFNTGSYFWCLISTHVNIGKPIGMVMVLDDNMEEQDAWFLSEVLIYCLSSELIVRCNCIDWIVPGQIYMNACTPCIFTKLTTLQRNFFYLLKTEHTFLSLTLFPPGGPYTRTRRCLFLLVIAVSVLLMCFPSLDPTGFDYERLDPPASDYFFTGFISSGSTAVVYFLLRTIFAMFYQRDCQVKWYHELPVDSLKLTEGKFKSWGRQLAEAEDSGKRKHRKSLSFSASAGSLNNTRRHFPKGNAEQRESLEAGPLEAQLDAGQIKQNSSGSRVRFFSWEAIHKQFSTGEVGAVEANSTGALGGKVQANSTGALGGKVQASSTGVLGGKVQANSTGVEGGKVQASSTGVEGGKVQATLPKALKLSVPDLEQEVNVFKELSNRITYMLGLRKEDQVTRELREISEESEKLTEVEVNTKVHKEDEDEDDLSPVEPTGHRQPSKKKKTSVKEYGQFCLRFRRNMGLIYRPLHAPQTSWDRVQKACKVNVEKLNLKDDVNVEIPSTTKLTQDHIEFKKSLIEEEEMEFRNTDEILNTNTDVESYIFVVVNTLLWMYAIGTSIYLMTYGSSYRTEVSVNWLILAFLGFILLVLVWEPLSMLFRSAIATFIIKREVPIVQEAIRRGLVLDESIPSRMGFEVNGAAWASNTWKTIIQLKTDSIDSRYYIFSLLKRSKQQKLYQKLQHASTGHHVWTCLIIFLLSNTLLDLYGDINQAYRQSAFVSKKFQVDLGRVDSQAKTVDSIWEYIDDVFLPILASKRRAQRGNETVNLILTSVAKVSQTRVKQEKECDSFLAPVPVPGLPLHCPGYYLSEIDDRDFNPNWQFDKNGERKEISKGLEQAFLYKTHKTFFFKELLGDSLPNGYEVMFGTIPENNKDLARKLKNNNWIDSRTRTLVFEFSLYNADVGMTTYFKIEYRFTGGGIYRTSSVDSFRINEITSSGFFFFFFIFVFLMDASRTATYICFIGFDSFRKDWTAIYRISRCVTCLLFIAAIFVRSFALRNIREQILTGVVGKEDNKIKYQDYYMVETDNKAVKVTGGLITVVLVSYFLGISSEFEYVYLMRSMSQKLVALLMIPFLAVMTYTSFGTLAFGTMMDTYMSPYTSFYQVLQDAIQVERSETGIKELYELQPKLFTFFRMSSYIFAVLIILNFIYAVVGLAYNDFRVAKKRANFYASLTGEEVSKSNLPLTFTDAKNAFMDYIFNIG